MARLEAIAKALYYPTPTRVVELIAAAIKITASDPSKLALLDICAGEGTAASILGARLGVATYGVELHQGRAAAAGSVLTWAACGSYHQLVVLNEKGEPFAPSATDVAASPFDILFLNPPYDDQLDDDDGARIRQEVEFLRVATRLLKPGGLLIFVPPRKVLAIEAFRKLLASQYTAPQAYAFPAPEIEAFDQVVVIAHKRQGYGYSYSSAAPDADNLTSLETLAPGSVELRTRVERWTVLPRVEVRGRAPESYVPRHDAGAWATPQWCALVGASAAEAERPLVAPRVGHQAMLLAAGALNGLELETPSGRVLVKGGSLKTVVVKKEQGQEVHREKIAAYLATLDLETKQIDTWQVDENPERTAGWFAAHGPALGAAILGSHSPQFTAADLARFDFAGLTAPGILPGRTAPEILPIQREASAAVAFRWRASKAAILCGEMGTGKTTMAVVACELTKAHKVVVLCPTHLTKKWKREAEVITGRRGCAMIAKKVSDVDAFFADDELTYLILSKETAKLGARWQVATSKRVHIVEEEVVVGHSYYNETRTVKRARRFAACPTCGADVRWDIADAKKQGKCSAKGCGSPLWQSTPITDRGTKRWPLATYLSDHYVRQYHLVVDEAHQHAKGDTDQASASHRLISGARKVLMMTGTLYGGRASSLFFLLHRIDPAFRRAYKHGDGQVFVAHHGLFEKVYKEEDTRTSVYGYRKGNTGGRLREIPGMSPAMIPLLLPFTIFVKLLDMQLEMPPYTEEVMIVEPDPDVQVAVSDMQQEAKKALRENPRALGAYLQACLGYPDYAEEREEIWSLDDEGDKVKLLASAEAQPDATYPKDDAIVELVTAERKADRRVLVFFTQVERRDARSRVRARLEEAGYRVVVLDGKVPPEKREEWMRERCEEGFDVMLTNGRLVETGLDLMFANTIVQYGIEYSLSTLRQSIRRSWRLGQTKPVRVVFMAYGRTMQASATNLIARKMRAAELVDGDAAGGLAQHDTDGGDFLLELAREAIEGE